MKKNVLRLILSTVIIITILSCENKKSNDEKKESAKQIDSTNVQQTRTTESEKPNAILSFESYDFAENLKNDSFFESDNVDKKIELKNVGITSYFISGDQATLSGVFYNPDKNLCIPRPNNNPPGRSFVSEYFDKKEVRYDDKYKTTYSASLYIVLKNPRDVKKLKMFIATEPTMTYEYKVEGSVDEYRSGFVDLLNITGVFKGLSANSVYPEKIYEISNAEIN